MHFPAWADFTDKVVGIADGDTVTVLDVDKMQHKVRLTGIDATEKKQSFGNRSKQSLSDMVQQNRDGGIRQARPLWAGIGQRGYEEYPQMINIVYGSLMRYSSYLI